MNVRLVWKWHIKYLTQFVYLAAGYLCSTSNVAAQTESGIPTATGSRWNCWLLATAHPLNGMAWVSVTWSNHFFTTNQDSKTIMHNRQHFSVISTQIADSGVLRQVSQSEFPPDIHMKITPTPTFSRVLSFSPYHDFKVLQPTKCCRKRATNHWLTTFIVFARKIMLLQDT